MLTQVQQVFSSDQQYPFFQMNMVFYLIDNSDFLPASSFHMAHKNQEWRQSK